MAAARSRAVDGAIRGLFEPPGGSNVALTAVGGYGRGLLAPRSDVDLLLLCTPDVREVATARFERVLYPLWNAGLQVGHALRTPEECELEALRDLPTLTSLLSIRSLGGSGDLVEETRPRVLALARSGDFVDALRESRVEREARTGRLAETQRPDLRDAIGGLRDVQVVDWISLRPSTAPRASPPEVESAADFLWRVRIALHRVSGSTSNVLAPEHQPAVAEMLEVPPRPGWEPADVLARMAAEKVSRAVETTATKAQSRPAPTGASAR